MRTHGSNSGIGTIGTTILRGGDRRFNVTEHAQVETAATRMESELGRIYVWINDAIAIFFCPMEHISPEDFERATRVTYLGAVWVVLDNSGLNQVTWEQRVIESDPKSRDTAMQQGNPTTGMEFSGLRCVAPAMARAQLQDKSKAKTADFFCLGRLVIDH